MHRFAQLQAVDVEGVPPALRADLSDENVTRPDEAVQYQDRCHEQTDRTCNCLPVCRLPSHAVCCMSAQHERSHHEVLHAQGWLAQGGPRNGGRMCQSTKDTVRESDGRNNLAKLLSPV